MPLPNEFPEAGSLGPGLPAALAARLGDQSQLEFDIEFFGRILKLNPVYVDVLRCQGQLLSRKGLHKQALDLDRRLVRLRPCDAVAHYNLGCSLALLGFLQEAIGSLRSALKNGYDDFEHLCADTDLDSLRDEPEYHHLLRDYGIEED